MEKVIFLIGFMGAGKTTLAKQIAQQYGYTYIDTDLEIEKTTGKSIAQIFEEEGEQAFRKLEASALRSISFDKNTVVATGGGLPCHYNNMEWMNEHGITIYLKLTPQQLKERLGNEAESRPLLKNAKKTTLLTHIEHLTELREPYYNLAKFVILGTLASPQTIINTTTSEC